MSIAWYREAATNLGVMSLLRLQLAKRFGAKASLGRLSSRHLRHPIWYRGGTSDMSVFHQIFVEREYACVDSLKNVRFIVDCGANVGYSSAYFLSRFPEAFVVAIEPDPANYALLQRNLAPYAGRYRTMQAAVWSVPTTLYFDVETLGDGAEWGRTVGEDGRSGAAVEAIDLATILAGEGRSRIDLLKVDIEGAESEVFSRNTEGWIGAVDNFVMEVHGPDCQNAVDRAIAGRGFAISEHGELMVGIGQR